MLKAIVAECNVGHIELIHNRVVERTEHKENGAVTIRVRLKEGAAPKNSAFVREASSSVSAPHGMSQPAVGRRITPPRAFGRVGEEGLQWTVRPG